MELLSLLRHTIRAVRGYARVRRTPRRAPFGPTVEFLEERSVTAGLSSLPAGSLLAGLGDASKVSAVGAMPATMRTDPGFVSVVGDGSSTITGADPAVPGDITFVGAGA